MTSKTYPYIRAWCRMMGSTANYTAEQVLAAGRDKAPVTAIYKRNDGKWSTFEDITDGDTKRVIRNIVEEAA